VGIHKKDNKTYDGTQTTTAEVGLWQEFGTVQLPARVWLRIFSLIEDEKESLREAIHKAIEKNDTADGVFNDVGAFMKERIKGRILANEVTPHSHNKSGITLVDTGQLVNSIDYEVHNV
jgi:hypothetical protein